MPSHRIDLAFKKVSQLLQLVLKFGLQGLKRVLDSLLLGTCEVSISLDLSCNILKLGFQLLSGLDLLTEHNVIILVHLHHLLIQVLQSLVIILSHSETAHVLLRQYLLLAHLFNYICFC